MRHGTAFEQDTQAPATRLKPVERFFLRAVLAGLLGIVALTAAHAVTGVGGAPVDAFIRTLGGSLVYVLTAVVVAWRAIRLPRERGGWAVMALGLTLYAAGNVVWTLFYDSLEAPPIPSVSDLLWLSLYPASYVGLVMLARQSNLIASAGVWLDGMIAGLGLATVGAAVVFGPVLASAAGGTPVAIMTNLAYPIADLLLAALVMALLALRGWRVGRVWGLLALGFLLLCIADSMYLLNVAAGAAQVSVVPNLFYMAGVVGIAFAAWQPRRNFGRAQIERWSVMVMPALFVVTALAVLVADHFHKLTPLAVLLSAATLLVAIVRTALTFRDVRALAATRRQAMTDDLTSLPNRRQFMQKVEAEITTARRDGGAVAVMIIDLDRFKTINDTLGHQAGDRLLGEIGPRVSSMLRGEDMLARLGGDEFGVVLSGPCDERIALGVADRVIDALRRPFSIEGLPLHVTGSIGIALFPDHSSDARQLLRHADVAMYEAKAARCGRELYSPERDKNTRDNLALASELPTAIKRGELEVHFQPKAQTVSGEIVGMEALVRWRHPKRGLLPPSAFVELAEQAGIARDLTRTVMADALSQCRRWRDQGFHVPVSVNVAFTDLRDAEFVLEVVALLAQHGVEPEGLIIEVTEQSIISDATRVGDALARLSEFGVRISLDDFGTGYSSLMHLRTLPVSEVKVDRSFVATMREDRMNAAIVRSTVQLAHNLGLRVVAEGVEDDETRLALLELGCDLIQGYFLSRPLPPDEADAFLANSLTPSSPPPPAERTV